MTAPSFVQIATSEKGIFGLDAGGRVWQFTGSGWERLPNEVYV